RIRPDFWSLGGDFMRASKPRSIRWVLAICAAASVTNAVATQAPSKDVRVMSINLCTDALVLDLLPPERITSVSYLARFSTDTGLAAKAARVGVNYGMAEEVVAQNPSLVVAGTFAATATRQVLKRAGFAMIEVPPANDFDDIRKVTRQVGKAVGQEETA